MEPLELVLQVLRLERTPFREALADPKGLRLALTIVLLAGLSSGLGQSLVLFINRVRPRRFVGSLLVSALLYFFGFFFWTVSVWLVARTLFGRPRPLLDVMETVGLAYSPYLFSFFVLTPYFGSFIAVALSVWSLLAILVATQEVFALGVWQAAACSALGWLLWQLSQRTVGRPVLRLARWIRRVAAGTPLYRQQRPSRRVGDGLPPAGPRGR